MHRVSSALSLAYRGPRLPAPSPGREHAARSGAVVVPVWYGALGRLLVVGEEGVPRDAVLFSPSLLRPSLPGRVAARFENGRVALWQSPGKPHIVPRRGRRARPRRVRPFLSRASPSLPLLATRTRRVCRVRVLLLVPCRCRSRLASSSPAAFLRLGKRPVTSVPPRGRGDHPGLWRVLTTSLSGVSAFGERRSVASRVCDAGRVSGPAPARGSSVVEAVCFSGLSPPACRGLSLRDIPGFPSVSG